jgi:hypothetical protein
MWFTVTMLALRIFLTTFLFVAFLPAQVVFQKGDSRIAIEIDGKPFSTFYFGTNPPKPYLHPLRAADGTIVSRGYPMENIEGETRDHPHHRGLWFSHGDVNGYDFWMNEQGQHPKNEGHIVLKELRSAKDGRIEATFDWKATDGTLLLTEDRTMTFHGGKNRTVDMDIKLTAVAPTVKFGDTKEGTFAIRLATPLDEPHARAKGPERTGTMVDSEGKVGESEIWGKRAAWVDYSGQLNGKPYGVAFFDHPQNPKHPTYWHARSYGLFAANPFGEHDYYNDPKRDGSITLKKGETARFRYRVVIHAGDTKAAGVADLYKEYAPKMSSSATR